MPLATLYKGRVRAQSWARKMLRRIRRGTRHCIYAQHTEQRAMWKDVLLLGGPFVHSKMRRYLKLMGLEKKLRKDTVRQVHLIVALIRSFHTSHNRFCRHFIGVQIHHRLDVDALRN